MSTNKLMFGPVVLEIAYAIFINYLSIEIPYEVSAKIKTIKL